MIKVVITISGGCCTEVYSSEPVEVVVVDYDSGLDGPDEMVQRRDTVDFSQMDEQTKGMLTLLHSVNDDCPVPSRYRQLY